MRMKRPTRVTREATLDHQQETLLERARLEIQAATVRSIERLYVAAASRKAARREASVGTALRAMSMQHIQIQRCGMRANGADSCQIAKPRLAADRDTRNAESEFSAIAANFADVNRSSVVLAARMPTSWPCVACSSARSRTWRKRPPTGARRQWSIRILGPARNAERTVPMVLRRTSRRRKRCRSASAG